MVPDQHQYSRTASDRLRAFTYVSLVLCTAVTTSTVTWYVAVHTSTAADMMRLGGTMLSGVSRRSGNFTATAATEFPDAEEHRKAVIDRLYNGDDAADHLGSLRLLDPAVSLSASGYRVCVFMHALW